MKQTISFFESRDEPRERPRGSSESLYTDWQLLRLAELNKQLKFPQHVAETLLRPDIVVVSEGTRKNVNKKEWKARCLAVEVGCWGFEAGPTVEPTQDLESLVREGEEPSRRG